MPYRSKAQQRWMHAAEARGDVPKGSAEHWDDATKQQPGGFKSLPEKVKKPRKKAMTKKAFWSGFGKRAAVDDLAQVDAEVAAQDQAQPDMQSAQDPRMRKYNELGGIDPRSPEEMAAAQAADLKTLPRDVEGGASCVNCANWRQIDTEMGAGFCTHPEVKQDTADCQVCAHWDHPGVWRAWEHEDPSIVQANMGAEPVVDPMTGQPMDVGTGQQPQMPLDPITGQPMNPEQLQPDPESQSNGAPPMDPTGQAAAPGEQGAPPVDPAGQDPNAQQTPPGGEQTPPAKSKSEGEKSKSEPKKEKSSTQNVHVHVHPGSEKTAFGPTFRERAGKVLGTHGAHAAEIAGLGILAAGPTSNIIKGKSDWKDKAEVAGLGTLAIPSAVHFARAALKR